MLGCKKKGRFRKFFLTLPLVENGERTPPTIQAAAFLLLATRVFAHGALISASPHLSGP